MQAEGPNTRDRAGSSRAVRSTLHEVPKQLVVTADSIFGSEHDMKMSAPRFSIPRSDQAFEFVSSLTLLPNVAWGYLDIPSVRVFFTPVICFAIRLHRPLISRRPRILMSRLARSPLAPPQRLTHDTAATLSRASTQDPLRKRACPLLAPA